MKLNLYKFKIFMLFINTYNKNHYKINNPNFFQIYKYIILYKIYTKLFFFLIYKFSSFKSNEETSLIS